MLARWRNWPWPKWLVAGALGVVIVAGIATAVFRLLTRNPSPTAFYDPPSEVPAERGSIIRSERFTDGMPAGSQAWRVLYASTDEEGKPIAVSGLIIAPQNPPPGPRPVLAWAHGTLGIKPACAPSLTGEPLLGIPDMTAPLREGWILALTDYPGMGTPGTHPYLVGGSEGRTVLDSVRATRQLDLGVEVDTRYAIWGHSQGGHAALFAGQLAPTYAPELELVGVAALSPATILRDNLKATEGTEVNKVLTIFAVTAWSSYYDDISDGILTRAARRPAERIANACINQPSRLRILASSARLPDQILDIDVTEDPTWTARLEQNTPSPAGIGAPLFVGQGLSDEIIAAQVTQDWVNQRCAAGRQVEFRTYLDISHPAVVGPGGDDAFRWTVERLARVSAANTCAQG